MPKFHFAYAYDISYYSDFIVEAKSIDAARRKAQAAFKKGRFKNVVGEPCFDAEFENRVFEMAVRPVSDQRFGQYPSMDSLIASADAEVT